MRGQNNSHSIFCLCSLRSSWTKKFFLWKFIEAMMMYYCLPDWLIFFMTEIFLPWWSSEAAVSSAEVFRSVIFCERAMFNKTMKLQKLVYPLLCTLWTNPENFFWGRWLQTAEILLRVGVTGSHTCAWGRWKMELAVKGIALLWNFTWK